MCTWADKAVHMCVRESVSAYEEHFLSDNYLFTSCCMWVVCSWAPLDRGNPSPALGRHHPQPAWDDKWANKKSSPDALIVSVNSSRGRFISQSIDTSVHALLSHMAASVEPSITPLSSTPLTLALAQTSSPAVSAAWLSSRSFVSVNLCPDYY